MIPDGTIGRSEAEKGEFGLEGISWGMEEMPRAHVDVVRVREKYARIRADAVRQLEHFVEVTQQTSAGPRVWAAEVMALGKDEDMAGSGGTGAGRDAAVS